MTQDEIEQVLLQELYGESLPPHSLLEAALHTPLLCFNQMVYRLAPGEFDLPQGDAFLVDKLWYPLIPLGRLEDLERTQLYMNAQELDRYEEAALQASIRLALVHPEVWAGVQQPFLAAVMAAIAEKIQADHPARRAEGRP